MASLSVPSWARMGIGNFSDSALAPRIRRISLSTRVSPADSRASSSRAHSFCPGELAFESGIETQRIGIFDPFSNWTSTSALEPPWIFFALSCGGLAVADPLGRRHSAQQRFESSR